MMSYFIRRHTAIIFIVILIFAFVVYGTSDKIGSAGTMYDLLQVASDLDPIHGNKDGQLVTMASNGGLLFGYSEMYCLYETEF